jgi:superfamily II DNA or RNA helicase
VNRAHAHSLEDQFRQAGITTAYVDAFTERADRTRIGDAFIAGRIKVVVNVGCLTTGVDWDVRCLILARPTKSEMLFVQIVGRALRIAEGKADALILDHSDTTLRLGFPDDIHHDQLDDGKPMASARTTRERPAPLPKECPSCHYLKPPRVHVCPSCGFAPTQREDVEVADGKLVQIAGGKVAADRSAKQRFWSGLLWYCQQRGYAHGWAAHKFRERFGVWPRGLQEIARSPDADCRNYIKAAAIRFAKGREKANAHSAA